eukprot:403336117
MDQTSEKLFERSNDAVQEKLNMSPLQLEKEQDFRQDFADSSLKHQEMTDFLSGLNNQTFEQQQLLPNVLNKNGQIEDQRLSQNVNQFNEKVQKLPPMPVKRNRLKNISEVTMSKDLMNKVTAGQNTPTNIGKNNKLQSLPTNVNNSALLVQTSLNLAPITKERYQVQHYNLNDDQIELDINYISSKNSKSFTSNNKKQNNKRESLNSSQTKNRDRTNSQLELDLNLQRGYRNHSIHNQNSNLINFQDQENPYEEMDAGLESGMGFINQPQIQFIKGVTSSHMRNLSNQLFQTQSIMSVSQLSNSLATPLRLMNNSINRMEETNQTNKRNTNDFDSIKDNDISFTTKGRLTANKIQDGIQSALENNCDVFIQKSVNLNNGHQRNLSPDIMNQFGQNQIIKNAKLQLIQAKSPTKYITKSILSKKNNQPSDMNLNQIQQIIQEEDLNNDRKSILKAKRYSKSRQKEGVDNMRWTNLRTIKIKAETSNELNKHVIESLEDHVNLRASLKQSRLINEIDSFQRSFFLANQNSLTVPMNFDKSHKNSIRASIERTEDEVLNTSILNNHFNNKQFQRMLLESQINFLKSQNQFYCDQSMKDQNLIAFDSQFMRYVDKPNITKEEAKRRYDEGSLLEMCEQYDVASKQGGKYVDQIHQSQANFYSIDNQDLSDVGLGQVSKIGKSQTQSRIGFHINKLIVQRTNSFKREQTSLPNNQNEQVPIEDDISDSVIIRQKPNVFKNKTSQKSGILLMKKESNKIKRLFKMRDGWCSRYCQMKNKMLKFYKDKDFQKLDGVIDFDLLTFTLHEHQNANVFRFEILGTHKTFVFKAQDNHDYVEWIEIITEHHNKSVGKYQKQDRTAKLKNFWVGERISENQFQYFVDSGDLLLFKGKSFTSKLNQFAQNSDYDHVGLLLRYSQGNVVLFEATGETGVTLTDWHDFLYNDWHLLYDKIVYRKLHWERPSNLLTKLETFIKQRSTSKRLLAKKFFKQKEQQIVITVGSSIRGRKDY